MNKTNLQQNNMSKISNGVKLLIITQAVDTEDPVLGFFVRWIEELAKHAEHIEVICLKSGTFNFPKNVRVHSLGKEKGVSRLTYVLNFYRYISSLSYDTVFVHMNEEYVLLGGLFWWLGWTNVVLWRNHKMGSWLTRCAAALSTTVCYTSPEAFVARYKNAVQMPVGIDTDFFKPASVAAPEGSILFLGRLDPVKKAEAFVEALESVSRPFRADLYGSPTKANEAYAARMVTQAQPLVEKRVLIMHPSVPHNRTRELYQSHAVYVNLTPSGSFDKTIGEAMASGCLVVCANEALQNVVNPAYIVGDSAQDVTRGINTALSLSPDEYVTETRKLRAYIEECHSLSKLITQLEYELCRYGIYGV